MNNGILTSGHAPPAMTYPLLGRRTPTPTPDAYYHPEAADWEQRVRANGGRVQTSVLQAVSRFCHDIDRAGLRDRFFRLSLMCGDNLVSCLVPLYLNPTPTGNVIGNSTDTNVGFVSGDYGSKFGDASHGLIASVGSGGKTLNTGVDLSGIGLSAANFHMMMYTRGTSSGRDNAHLYHAPSGGRATGFATYSSGVANARFSNEGFSQVEAPSGGTQDGFVLATRNNSNVIGYYLNRRANFVALTSFNNFFYSNLGGTVRLAFDDASFKRYFAYSFGRGMSTAQIADYQGALVAFQLALGRYVPRS